MPSRKTKPELRELQPLFWYVSVAEDVTTNAGEHAVALNGIAVIIHPGNPAAAPRRDGESPTPPNSPTAAQ
jgi:hypothetical protein